MRLESDGFEITPKAVGPTIQQFCKHRLAPASLRYLPVHPIPYTAREIDAGVTEYGL